MVFHSHFAFFIYLKKNKDYELEFNPVRFYARSREILIDLAKLKGEMGASLPFPSPPATGEVNVGAEKNQ